MQRYNFENGKIELSNEGKFVRFEEYMFERELRFDYLRIMQVTFIRFFEMSNLKGDEKLCLQYSFVDKQGKTNKIILWAPGRYVYVFVSENRKDLFSLKEEDLKLLSCHDSCWRSDGVEFWFRSNAEKLRLVSFIDGLIIIKVPEETAKLFRKIENKRFA